MALTTDQQIDARRKAIQAAFPGTPSTVTKGEIDAAVAACVAWIEANAASAVAAMNGTVLAGAPVALKAQILALAITARYGG